MKSAMRGMLSILLGGAAASLMLTHASVANAAVSCTLKFDEYPALNSVKGAARDTFAVSTSINSSGKLDNCSKAAPGNACWTYRQFCFSDHAFVDDVSGYGHFHLSFTDPSMDTIATGCDLADPGDGYGYGFKKKVGNQCVFPDWALELRALNSHTTDQWIQIQMRVMKTKPSPAKPFGVTSVTVGGTVPIQFWFHSLLDNRWYAWSSFPPGTTDVSAWVHDVDSVQIRGADGASGSYRLEQIVLSDY